MADSLGQVLRSTRERKRISLSYAAAQTRIKVQYLEWMERDDFSRMPAPAYAKGFIRMYAGFLGLDPVPLVQEYQDQHEGRKAPPAPRPTPAAAKPELPWLLKKRPSVSGPPPASAPVPAEPPRAEPAPDRPAPAPAETLPPAPRSGRRLVLPRLDVAAMWRVVAGWPWRQLGALLLVAALVVGLVNALSRCARRSEAPALPRPVEFKRGVPAVVLEPPEPYLAVPGEPAERAP